MHRKAHFHTSIFGITSTAANAALAILLTLLFLMFLLLFMTLTAQPAQGQTFAVIHSFTGTDGANPFAGLTMDASGNLYGTTLNGGTGYNGTVFKLRHAGSGWVLATLYSFPGGDNGSQPTAGVTIGKEGSLYGTTFSGGLYPCGQPSVDCGVVFNLKPPATAPRSALYSWNETLLYSFTGGADGGYPNGDLTFDRAGNIYGTDGWGGYEGYGSGGAVFELTRSGDTWTETTLYSPTNNGDGQTPSGGVIFDNSGNMYGVFVGGGPNGGGAVYEISPSGSGWNMQYLYAFAGQSGGPAPIGGLMFDPHGNLFGTTAAGGTNGGGMVFQLVPGSSGWTFNLLYSFPSPTCTTGACGPQDRLVMDGAGNLYGTTWGGGAYGFGSVFKLSPSGSGWTYASLHDFTGGSDGAKAKSNVVLDAQGNLYGTAAYGGMNGDGVVWEITP
jgi:uncharacterized repeat protein (TIGR03803 family)